MKEFNKDYQRYYNDVEKIIKRKKNTIKQEIMLQSLHDTLLQHQNDVGDANKLSSRQKFVESLENQMTHETVKAYKKGIENKYVGAGMLHAMCYYIVLMFIKGLVAKHYLINYYVDSIVAFIAVIVVATQMKKEYDILKSYKLALKPLLIVVVGMVVSLVIVVLMARSPFDVSFLIIVIAMLTNKKLFIQQWNAF